MSKITSARFLKLVSSEADKLRQYVENAVDKFDTDPAATRVRINQARDDFHFFARTYFPHYITSEPSVFQQFVFDVIPGLIDDPIGHQKAIAAPRGEAKSTLISQILTLWCLITNRKKFVVIIMDSMDQSVMMLEAIKIELESNARLLQDYPDHTGEGRTWQVGDIITAKNQRVRVAGSGKKVRGWKHGPARPDLVILDDIENDENVRSKSQRDKVANWVQKAVLKLGPPDGSMDTLFIGTVLHYDSFLNRCLIDSAWSGVRFKAIITLPDRLDLWDAWEELLRNDGREAADKFYKRRRKIMNDGAVVSWPSTRGLYALMLIRAADHHAFDSEYQNDPTNSEHAPFKKITFWVQETAWQFYGACDPSLGKTNKNRDPCAILVGGVNSKSGVMDVVHADVSRKTPDLIIESIIDLHAEFQCLVWGIEAIQFQEFLMTEIIKRSRKRGMAVPAQAIKPNTDKNLRIASLQPHVANASVRLHKNQTTLIEQLRHWPEADHDDGPDALHMLWSLAQSGLGGIPVIATTSPSTNYYAANY